MAQSGSADLLWGRPPKLAARAADLGASPQLGFLDVDRRSRDPAVESQAPRRVSIDDLGLPPISIGVSLIAGAVETQLGRSACRLARSPLHR